MIYLEIAVNVSHVDDVFHYHLPPELEGRVQTGHLVVVPFGEQRVQGVVLRQVAAPAVPETRPVAELVDPKAVVTPDQIRFAEALAAEANMTLAAAVNLMLPAGLAQHADRLFSLLPGPRDPAGLSALQKRLLNLLERRGALRGRQIDRAVPRTNWRASMRALTRRKMVSSESVLLPPAVRAKFIRMAQIAAAPKKVEAAIADLGATEATQSRREKILRFLLAEAVPVDVSWVYAQSGGNLADLKLLAERELIVLLESEVLRDPLEGMQVAADLGPLQLTADQRAAWCEVESALESPQGDRKPFLLHGVTGSGKTEIYLRAVERTLAAGRQALVLVPEIALTPQTVRRFMARFPGAVGLLHSQLSPGESYDTWRRARRGDLSVVIGPRSALFVPLPKIGLIVLDESHDSSYYQSEPPFYQTRTAAAAYARLLDAVCVLGSATPALESRYLAETGAWRLLELPQRIVTRPEAIRGGGQVSAAAPKSSGPGEWLPPIRVVDMRQELKAGNLSIFSRALQETLGAVLEQGQQAILFLNRRGMATYVFCRDCGHSLRCPRCDEVALTFHRSEAALTCHHCGYRRSMPETCPNCRSSRIRQYGTGTERVEQEVLALFPHARTLRWDRDTTRKKGAHDLILHHFANHQADVLVGTQMLAKGLDLPLVTLVGIVLADVGLHLPDFRAGERAFQTLTQVAGRAGRSALGGEVVLQTFDPQQYVIRAVAGYDYKGFYAQELAYRRELGYPPFGKLVRLEYRDLKQERARQAAQALAGKLAQQRRTLARRQTEIIGPAPAFYSRLDGRYRWQIVLRGPDPQSLLRGLSLPGWRVEVEPQSLL
jgi:primosomal protein N' (replication factor Y)